MFKGDYEYLYGETFLKLIFIPIPRYLFPDKPRSMISVYTSIADLRFRSIVGSCLFSIYSELICDFGVFSFPILFFMSYYINLLYKYMVVSFYLTKIESMFLIALFLSVTIIMFIRGSGIEMWFLYSLIPLPIVYVLRYIILN
jgi:hypothetical protein